MAKSYSFRIALVMLIVLLLDCSADKKPKGPNLLLITIDTLRADYLGCYGSPDVKSPEMDRLAESGILFKRHVSTSQCTNPSHVSIMTGLYPSVHQVLNNRTALAESASTLAEILQKKGYHTLGAVSVRHLNPEVANLDQGFDEYLGCQEPVELKAGERNQELIKKIGSLPEKPFFIWAHYFDPHGPYEPPAPYDTLYPVKSLYDPVPPHSEMNLTPKQKSSPVDPDVIIPLYKGEITYLDSQIGRLVQALKEHKRYDNTLIVLVADHGESMVEKNIYFCHAGMYNQVLHVPLIISFPEKIPRGISVNTLTSSVDIFPTILNILKISYPPGPLPGKSLVPLFTSPDKRLHQYIISEAVNGVIRAVYTNDFKYIKPFPTDWACKEDHLFRPWSDYWESKELKTRHPKLVRRLENYLSTWLLKAGKKALSSQKHKKLDEKTRKSLKTLGYIDEEPKPG
jgi:arylsulfatase A-like enzyme